MAAIKLYNGVLKYDIRETDKGYYADGEDAFDMCVFFNKLNKPVDEVKETGEETKVLEDNPAKGGTDNLAESNVVKEMAPPPAVV